MLRRCSRSQKPPMCPSHGPWQQKQNVTNGAANAMQRLSFETFASFLGLLILSISSLLWCGMIFWTPSCCEQDECRRNSSKRIRTFRACKLARRAQWHSTLKQPSIKRRAVDAKLNTSQVAAVNVNALLHFLHNLTNVAAQNIELQAANVQSFGASNVINVFRVRPQL